LRIHPKNPRYFTDDSGKAIWVTGSHTWNNMVDMGRSNPPPAFDWDWYLNWLNKHNHNFVRLWASDALCTWSEKDSVNHFPWKRTGPGKAKDGKPRFDLTKLDPAYFERLRNRLQSAQERGIYINIMFFDGWFVHPSCKTRMEMHLFAGGNNINGIDILKSEKDDILRDFVTMDNRKVIAIQEAYVRKVVETANPFNNVIYEIANEAGKHSHDWQDHFVWFVRKLEKKMPKQHPVGMTGGTGTLQKRTFESPSDYVSPDYNSPDSSGKPYTEGFFTWGSAPFDPGTKPVILDTDHLWGLGGDEVWAWKSFCRGYHVLYMDRYSDEPWTFFEHGWWPLPSNKALRREMGKILALADEIDLARMTPRNRLCTTGYCLANPGKEYVAYQPGSGPFSLQLKAGDYECRWHNPSNGKSAGKTKVKSKGAFVELRPPFKGDAVAYVRRVEKK